MLPLFRSWKGLGAASLLAAAAPSCFAQFSYAETFRGTSAAGWNFYRGNSGPAPRLTAGATPDAADPEFGRQSVIDAVGNGWLRLATSTSNQSNAAYFDAALPSLNNDITIRFSVAMWGDRGIENGGDGLTFFMRDASTDFSVGAFGGSLGYAQKSAINGVSGGYFGVALDVYGNYSAESEGREGGVGRTPNSVVVRGPGSGTSGYDYLAGTGGKDFTATGGATVNDASDPSIAPLPYSLSAPTATQRPDQTVSYRNVEINLTADSQLFVKMQFGEDQQWRTVLSTDLGSFSRPDMMSFGFSAGTGDANQVYEIGNSFSVTASAASNTFVWDNGATSLYKGVWDDAGDAENNWVSNSLPTDRSNILLNDSKVTRDQTIDLQDTDKRVGSLYLSGSRSYTLTGDTDSRRLIFDASGNTSHLLVSPSPTGNANHIIDVDVDLVDSLVIENYVANQSLTFGQDVALNNRSLTITGNGTTIFNGTISDGSGTSALITKEGTGLLTFAGSVTTDDMVLAGGTLLLDSASVRVRDQLSITGNSILDFGTGGGSTLTVNSLQISSGVTLTIRNWTDTIDFFLAALNPGATNLGRIVFAGWPSTTWSSATHQIRPVPEPGTYGALLMGALSIGWWVRRRMQVRR